MEEFAMKVTTIAKLAAVLLAFSASAHGQASAQSNASTSGGASAQAGKLGTQVSGGGSASSATSARANQGSASLSSGTTMNAALSQPVDARKCKPGDPVSAQTTQSTKSDGRVVVPKGSKLVGHVTEAKARAKGESESSLGIVFDKAILKNGQEVPLNVTVQALAASQSAAALSGGEEDLSAGAGAAGGASGRAAGGALGGVRSTAGAAAGTVTNTAASAGGVVNGAGGTLNAAANVAGSSKGAVGGLNSAGQLTSNSRGVFGLDGLNLNSAASSSTQGSLITSASRNVHLDKGTQILLVSQGQASATASQQ
jgi:hypothetical protein